MIRFETFQPVILMGVWMLLIWFAWHMGWIDTTGGEGMWEQLGSFGR